MHSLPSAVQGTPVWLFLDGVGVVSSPSLSFRLGVDATRDFLAASLDGEQTGGLFGAMATFCVGVQMKVLQAS